jgi:hypothetical protein
MIFHKGRHFGKILTCALFVLMHSFVLFAILYKDDQIKEDEMGGACSAYMVDEKCVHNFG